jgi:protein-tyrosine phosphatase
MDALPGSRTIAAMTRLLALEGGRNFRDLGGYPAADGRVVGWRRLYRSGVMSYFSDADCAHLETLDVQVICDLRAPDERRREALRWTDTRTRHLHWDYDNSAISLRGLLMGGEPSAAGVRKAMIQVYQRLPEFFVEPYRALFEQLAAGRVPLVFNCSAGKDRTGVAAALVLTSLGVAWEHVLADYELTNALVDMEQELARHRRGSVAAGDEIERYVRLPPEVRTPLFQAAPEYLQAAFDVIAQQFGSVGAYLESRLGVTEAMAVAIRDHLLVAPPPAVSGVSGRSGRAPQ